MTEREKMFAGKIYDPFCEGMPAERTRAHKLCRLYNKTDETHAKKREKILNQLLPNRGEGVYLQGPIYFDFGTNTTFGKGSYANFNLVVLDEGKVTIGDSVFIGPNVSFLTPIHPLRYEDRNAFFILCKTFAENVVDIVFAKSLFESLFTCGVDSFADNNGNIADFNCVGV